jgi:hypothetical protein
VALAVPVAVPVVLVAVVVLVAAVVQVAAPAVPVDPSVARVVVVAAKTNSSRSTHRATPLAKRRFRLE